jgi:acetoin utilization deacetylase AcuC-like enzyme
VDCTLTATRHLLEGRRLSYALVRPPGHHAERRVFGGFCYFNSAAVAAHYLSSHGKVAVLDIDYHHGNGTQEIFYERADVLTVSLHGHPSFAYPYFSGFTDEKGTAGGRGYNYNLPLPERLDGVGYRRYLGRALTRIKRFRPQFLIIALGLDTAHGDPTGTWDLLPADFTENGRLLGVLQLPTLVVQEGGYDTRVLGENARHFFHGLWQGAFAG